MIGARAVVVQTYPVVSADDAYSIFTRCVVHSEYDGDRGRGIRPNISARSRRERKREREREREMESISIATN